MKTLCAAVAATALFFTLPAAAECRKVTAADLPGWEASQLTDGTLEMESVRQASFSSSEVEVEATHPVNTPITAATAPSPGRVYVLLCENVTGSIHYDLVGAPAAIGPDIYPTGVRGVGYRVKYVRASGTESVLPMTVGWAAKPPELNPEYAAIAPGNVFVVELIKTGEMDSVSTINLGTVARLSGGADFATVLSVIADPVTLKVLPHCWVAGSKSLLVDFGSFGPKEVSTTAGPTKPVVIDVACDGPTAPNTVSATLAATPDLAVPDYIRNDGNAANLAIRLRDAGSLQVLKPQNASSKLVRTAPGFNTSFALEASVLRVGAAAPTPGTIDAQAVVTLTFL